MEVGTAAQSSSSSISAEDIVDSPSCYCRKPRNLFESELLCNKCDVYFHARCLKTIRNVQYKKVAFNTSYLFVCENCSDKESETFKYKRPAFLNLLTCYMAQMTIARVAEMSKSGLIKKQFVPKPGTIFLTIHHVAKYLHEYWHLSRRYKKDFEKIHDDVKKIIKDYPQVFIVNPSFTTSFALGIPLYDIAKYSAWHLIKEETTSEITVIPRRRTRKKYVDIPTGDAIIPPCPFDQVPLNSDYHKYFAAEYDPHCKKIKIMDEQDVYHSFRFRQAVPNSVSLSLHDKASELIVSTDRLRVIGCEGYKMIRATHSVSHGTWYFEAIIEQCSPKACVRIGWSQLDAPLDCALGYSRLSYCVRSKKGTKFHNAVGRTYYPPGFKRKDVVGVLIHLPKEDRAPSTYTAETNKIYSVEGLDYRYFKHTTKGYAAEDNKLKSKPYLHGSRIEYFVNGKSCGVAFEDIYRGFYFPSISLYGYECPPEVSVTFDSSMKYLPKGARPMSERVDELTAELAANEMVDLVEAEEHLQRKKRLLSTK